MAHAGRPTGLFHFAHKKHVGITGDLDTVLSVSRCAGADSMLKSYRLESLEHVCDHYVLQSGTPGAEKAHAVGLPPSLPSLTEHQFKSTQLSSVKFTTFQSESVTEKQFKKQF